jgi:hypothetical protein
MHRGDIMDIVSVIAVVVGLAGAALGALAWLKAREAGTMASDAAREAQEAQRVAADAHLTATKALAATKAGLQPTPAGALSPEEPSSPGRADRAAHIVVRSGGSPGHELPTNQGTGSGLLGVFLVNEGPAVAHEMRLHATFPNGTRRSSESSRTLTADKELTLYAQVTPPDFGTEETLHVVYLIAYRDGNGEQTIERDVRVEGGWKGPWRTFIDTRA